MIRWRLAIGICLGAWLVACLWLGSDAGMSFVAFFIVTGGGVGILVLWGLALGVAFGFRRRFPARWLEAVVVAVIWVAIFSGTLLDLRFLASKPFLERYVSRVIAGAPAHPGERVGLFVARETEVLPGGVVRIITTECALDDCGLVFSRGRPPNLGEDSYDPLGENWWSWWRSW